MSNYTVHKDVASLPSGLTEGRRNDELFRLGCALRSKGLPDSVIHSSMQNLNSELCQPPLDSKEVEAIATGICKSTTKSTATESSQEIKAFSAKSLLEKELPPTNWVIEDLLAEGLTIIAARPKAGKSWLTYSLCLSIAKGTAVLGRFNAKHGQVLYLALEDNEKRLQSRMVQMEANGDHLENLMLSIECPILDETGLILLSEWLDHHPECCLIAIDTLVRVMPQGKSKSDEYQRTTQILGGLQKLALQRGISIIVIHHIAKGDNRNVRDPILQVLGSTGLIGVADSIWVIARKQGENHATLHITGRDLDDLSLSMTFTPENCEWQVNDVPPSPKLNKSQQMILDFLNQAESPKSPKEVAEAVNLNANNVRQNLRRMDGKSLVEHLEGGLYWYKQAVTVSHETAEQSIPLDTSCDNKMTESNYDPEDWEEYVTEFQPDWRDDISTTSSSDDWQD